MIDFLSKGEAREVFRRLPELITVLKGVGVLGRSVFV